MSNLRAHQRWSACGCVNGQATVDDVTICTMLVKLTHGGKSHIQREVRQCMKRLCSTQLPHHLCSKASLRTALLHAMDASGRPSQSKHLQQLLCDGCTTIAVAASQEELPTARPLRQQGRQHPQLPAAPLIKVSNERLDKHFTCAAVGVRLNHVFRSLIRALSLSSTGSRLTHCCGTTTAAMQHVVASVLARITRSCIT